MITSRDFKCDPVLRESRIIKVRVGSNFLLKTEEFSRIETLWGSENYNETDEYEWKEGKISHRLHRMRERDSSLRKEFLAHFLRARGRLRCELCGLDPEKKYQKVGENLLEVHHTIPLHKLPEDVITKLTDLILVCPSCHRALHKGDAEKNLISLKNILQ